MVEHQPVTVPQSAGLCSAPGLAFGYGPGTPADGSLTISNFDNSTGQFTITPASTFAGVSEVFVGVETTSDATNDTPNFDSQYVPVFVTPTAPTVTLLTPSTFGIVGVNTGLQFQVSGLFERTRGHGDARCRRQGRRYGNRHRQHDDHHRQQRDAADQWPAHVHRLAGHKC